MNTLLELLLFCVLLQIATSQKQYAQKLCRTEDDCDWDQCCIEAETRFPGIRGICSPPTQRGQVCNPDPLDKTEDGRYRKACPCDTGLSCQSRKDAPQEDFTHVCLP